MKLRNRETGVVSEPDRVAIIRNIKETDTASFNRIAANYYSLAELNEEREDYKPKEPLIKDEKIRNVVKAWADENGSTRITYTYSKNELVDTYGNSISFNPLLSGLNDCTDYTIVELCGEEEE